MSQATCPCCGRPFDETTADSLTEAPPTLSNLDAESGQAQLVRYARELAGAAPYLPHVLRERISKGETSSTQCKVAVLIADLVDFTRLTSRMEPEEVFDVLNTCFRRLGGHVTRHGGEIDKFLGDGLMAVFFGSESGEDHTARAVGAALAMSIDMRNFGQSPHPKMAGPLRLHMGVSCGAAIAGTVDVRPLSYTVVGRTVSLAFRLQEEAPPGEILVSQPVQQATHSLFEYRYFDALSIKGFDKPVSTFVVENRRTR